MAFGENAPPFEVAVVHHTQCGTGYLADPTFRANYASRIGGDEEALAAQAVVDPEAIVRHDIERILSSSAVPTRVSVSGHVYDLDTGLITTVEPARSQSEPPSPLPGGRARAPPELLVVDFKFT